MATEYSIYVLKNTLTGECYVGKSKRLVKRKNQHFNKLRLGKHHSRKLQTAFDAYGELAFQWKVLQVNITEADSKSWEIFWIAALDAFTNGYNMNNGIPKYKDPKPCSWNGILYSSQKEAARSLGITHGAMNTRLKKGYTCDSDMPRFGITENNNPIPCQWNGQHFESVHAAAKTLGISPAAMHYRVEQGYTCDDDIRRNAHFVTWNGKTYRSNRAAAEDLGITPATMSNRLKRGLSSDADLKSKGKAA